jgi:HK97 family phage major capsid protein
MSKRIKELRQRLNAGIPDAAKAIREKAEGEGRTLNETEVQAISALSEEKATIQKDLEAAETLARLEARETFEAAPIVPSGIVVGDPNGMKRPWVNGGEFLAAVAKAYSPNSGGMDERLFAAASGMSQGVPSEGGFTVFPEFSSAIWDGMSSDPLALLPMTDNYTVTGESLTFNANAETSRVAGSRYGGIRGYWINEADAITTSKPKFRQVRVEPQELAVLCYVTDKLLANSGVALGQYISRAAGEEITFMVGDAIVNGTGVGQPKGILASASVVSVAKETSQVAATLVKENVNKMWARMHPRSRGNAVWLMNVDAEPQLDNFNTLVKNVAGSENVGGIPSVVYNAEKNTIKGRPIVYCEFCPTLGTVGDIILADMKGYVTGTRGGVKSAMSMHVRFEYAESAFRFMFAVDGQTWLASALTPFKGSNTLSTFVTCATRS